MENPKRTRRRRNRAVCCGHLNRFMDQQEAFAISHGQHRHSGDHPECGKAACDHSIDVTAEIANRSPNVTLAGNRLTVVPETSGGAHYENRDGKNEGSGTASADDPPRDTPVRVLEGSFDEIPPNSAVTVAFTIPPETGRREPLVVHFESIKLRYENTEEPRAIRVTVPLSVSD